MRKYIKKGISDIIGTLYEAHSSINDLIEQAKYDDVLSLLGECQNTAVEIGNIIENSEGEDFCAIHTLEDYCETVYQIAVSVSENDPDVQTKKKLDDSLAVVERSIESDIKIRLEIVFMPYKASMWDSLESVWRATDNDPDCDAYVVPIPYYDRNSDHSIGQFHYEGDLYPDNVPIVHYNNYDLKSRRPDVIYIHNPYDYKNYVTSVDPRFYSKELKKYTETLVYIPYFVLQEPNQINDNYLDFIDDYCLYPGIYNADKVIVQSEKLRNAYVISLLRHFGYSLEKKQYFEEKIVAGGSPKFDKVISTMSEEVIIPEHWKDILLKPNGDKKKLVFYNTSISAMINTHEKMLTKIRNVLNVFYEIKDEVALLWRPHPLMIPTLKSMFPALCNSYIQIVSEYIKGGWGIYDDTPDLDRAIALCDGYYGDSSSVVQLVEQTGKKTVIQSAEAPGIISYDENIVFPSFVEANGDLYFVQYFTNSLYVIKEDKIRFVGTLPSQSLLETRQHISAISLENHIYFLPCNSHTIVDYDICTNSFKEIELEIRHKVFPLWEYENNFRNGLIYKKRLYLIPAYYDSIVYYDFETKETVHCLNLREILKSIEYGDSALFVNYEFLTDHSILLPFLDSNNVLEFHLNTFEYKLHTIGNGRGFTSIHKYNGLYWLVENLKPIIYKWNYEIGTAEPIKPYPAGFNGVDGKSYFAGLGVRQIENMLYCFAGYSNMSVRINLETGECIHITELDDYNAKKESNIVTFQSTAVVGNDVYLHSPSRQCIVKYNIYTGETSEIEFLPDGTFTDEVTNILNKVIIKSLTSNNGEISLSYCNYGKKIYQFISQNL